MSDTATTIITFVVSFLLMFCYALTLWIAHRRTSARTPRSDQPPPDSASGAKNAVTELKPRRPIKTS